MEQTGPQTTHPQLLDVDVVALLQRAGAGQPPRQREHRGSSSRHHMPAAAEPQAAASRCLLFWTHRSGS